MDNGILQPPVPYNAVQYEGGWRGMAYETERVKADSFHRLTLEDRERLCVTGVEEVESFDENAIVMITDKGALIVRGVGLHIEQLSLDGGELKVDGHVDSITYEDEGRERGGLFSRLFR